MEARDLIVTPLFLILIYGGAYFLRPHVTDKYTRAYFFPALTLKLVGALALGFIYQFYYGSGDTFMYHTYGSRLVWETFIDSPVMGAKLMLASNTDYADVYQYASRIYFFRDPNSYAVIRISTIFDLFTFSTYSSTAALFAVLSFIGSWQFFLTFYKQFPHLHRWLAIAAFFIPSVFFWGSGILKDSITLASLGIATFQFYNIFIAKKFNPWNIVLLTVSLYVIYSIKVFILQAYLPAVILWIGTMNLNHVKSMLLRVMIVPFMMIILIVSSYYAVVKVGENDSRYEVSKIAETAKITAYDIRFFSGRDAGSGYILGELDGTFSSMLRLAPQAINVSLFRPYLWEVKNPLIFISALESLALLLLVMYVIFRKWRSLFRALLQPNIIFCLAFSLSFAFAVGVSTFNFGTLVRYKIPLMPLFVTAMVLILNYSNKERKLDRFESTE